MKNKEMKVKAMSMAVAMSMVVGLCPSTIFAATGSQTCLLYTSPSPRD